MIVVIKDICSDPARVYYIITGADEAGELVKLFVDDVTDTGVLDPVTVREGVDIFIINRGAHSMGFRSRGRTAHLDRCKFCNILY